MKKALRFPRIIIYIIALKTVPIFAMKPNTNDLLKRLENLEKKVEKIKTVENQLTAPIKMCDTLKEKLTAIEKNETPYLKSLKNKLATYIKKHDTLEKELIAVQKDAAAYLKAKQFITDLGNTNNTIGKSATGICGIGALLYIIGRKTNYIPANSYGDTTAIFGLFYCSRTITISHQDQPNSYPAPFAQLFFYGLALGKNALINYWDPEIHTRHKKYLLIADSILACTAASMDVARKDS